MDELITNRLSRAFRPEIIMNGWQINEFGNVTKYLRCLCLLHPFTLIKMQKNWNLKGDWSEQTRVLEHL